jgi:hypothetical protein
LFLSSYIENLAVEECKRYSLRVLAQHLVEAYASLSRGLDMV